MTYLPPAQAEPLFIIGCVRSGTTLVRDLLRRQPDTICPEETHYFRYGEPFRTDSYRRPMVNGKVLQKHREIDGIPQEDFLRIISNSLTRGDLMCRHVHYMAEARGLSEYRWFDKTPQNVYGLPLMHSEFPRARFLHLVRNPLNVTASLRLGKVINIADIHAACNYWLEAVSIIDEMAPVLGDKLLEVRYEDITSRPVESMKQLLEFSRMGSEVGAYSPSDAHPEKNQYLEVLTQQEQTIVRRRCGELAAKHGYDLS